jgi:hypothetical protein
MAIPIGGVRKVYKENRPQFENTVDEHVAQYFVKTRDYVRILRRTLGLYRFDEGAVKDHTSYDAANNKLYYEFWVDHMPEENYDERNTYDSKTYMQLDTNTLYANGQRRTEARAREIARELAAMQQVQQVVS